MPAVSLYRPVWGLAWAEKIPSKLLTPDIFLGVMGSKSQGRLGKSFPGLYNTFFTSNLGSHTCFAVSLLRPPQGGRGSGKNYL
jgi:hypothetical protein